jgi:hypothetical protein
VERKLIVEALQTGTTPPPPSFTQVPAPTWKDSKDRVLKEMNESKAKLAKLLQTPLVGAEWEEPEVGTLGHIVKSDVFKPREMLSLSGIKNVLDEDGKFTVIPHYTHECLYDRCTDDDTLNANYFG